MAVSWERRHEALKAIHDKIAEVLAKLDAPADPQIVEIVASIVLTVAQQSIERTLQKKGTPTRDSTTTNKEIVANPSAGNKLQVYGWFLKVDTDEIVTLRYGGENGQVFAGLPTKGVAAMNLLGIDESGGADENIFLVKSGSGNVEVVVWTEVVSV